MLDGTVTYGIEEQENRAGTRPRVCNKGKVLSWGPPGAGKPGEDGGRWANQRESRPPRLVQNGYSRDGMGPREGG